MLSQGCQSVKPVDRYIVIVPSLDFPVFPTSNEGDIVNNHDGTCTVLSEWVVRMQEFHIMYDAIEKDYNDIKERCEVQ